LKIGFTSRESGSGKWIGFWRYVSCFNGTDQREIEKGIGSEACSAERREVIRLNSREGRN
jgi:hypothetical protein